MKSQPPTDEQVRAAFEGDEDALEVVFTYLYFEDKYKRIALKRCYGDKDAASDARVDAVLYLFGRHLFTMVVSLAPTWLMHQLAVLGTRTELQAVEAGLNDDGC